MPTTPGFPEVYRHAVAHRDEKIARALDALGTGGGEIIPIRSGKTSRKRAVAR